MNASQYATLVNRLESHLRAVGAVDEGGRWVLATSIGTLRVTLEQWGRGRRRDRLISIFLAFDDASLAAARFPGEVNPYSGKWNMHFDAGSCTVESILNVFAAELARTRDARAELAAARYSGKYS